MSVITASELLQACIGHDLNLEGFDPRQLKAGSSNSLSLILTLGLLVYMPAFFQNFAQPDRSSVCTMCGLPLHVLRTNS